MNEYEKHKVYYPDEFGVDAASLTRYFTEHFGPNRIGDSFHAGNRIGSWDEIVPDSICMATKAHLSGENVTVKLWQKVRNRGLTGCSVDDADLVIRWRCTPFPTNKPIKLNTRKEPPSLKFIIRTDDIHLDEVVDNLKTEIMKSKLASNPDDCDSAAK